MIKPIEMELRYESYSSGYPVKITKEHIPLHYGFGDPSLKSIKESAIERLKIQVLKMETEIRRIQDLKEEDVPFKSFPPSEHNAPLGYFKKDGQWYQDTAITDITDR